MSGIQPVIAPAKGVPFSTAWLPEEQANGVKIQQIIAMHSECATIVVDVPKRTVQEVVSRGLRTAVLFPMRPAPHEIEVAVRDYREFQSHLKTVDAYDDKRTTGQCSGWLLPVSWPVSHSNSNLASSVARFDASTRSGDPWPANFLL